MKSFYRYRTEHMTHHKYLGIYVLDMDFMNLAGLELEKKLTKGVILHHLLLPLTGKHIRYYFGIDLSTKDGYSFFIIKVALVASALLYSWVEPLAALLFLVVPFVWVYSAINYWTDCIDHGGLLNNEDELSKSRNFVVHRWVRVVFFPRNDCFHLIHHLFPNLPVKHFDYCYELFSSPIGANDSEATIERQCNRITQHVKPTHDSSP